MNRSSDTVADDHTLFSLCSAGDGQQLNVDSFVFAGSCTEIKIFASNLGSCLYLKYKSTVYMRMNH